MPVVIVEMWEGRTVEQKKKLAEGITAAFTQIGIPAEGLHIIMKDNSKHNWASGGKLVSEEHA
jgi:4-oxalocrotonate tautomerase